MTAILVSERELQDNVIAMLVALQYRVYHTWMSLHSAGGFPDLVAVRHGRLLFIELKRETGNTRANQQEWLDELREAGAEAYLWRPSDLLNGTIERTLRQSSNVA